MPKELCVGEDSTSVETHVNVLQSECRKTHPDILTVKDRMAQKFSWRRCEIMEGVPMEDVLNKPIFKDTCWGKYCVNTVNVIELLSIINL